MDGRSIERLRGTLEQGSGEYQGAPSPRGVLSADQAEVDALTVYAEDCETTVVHYTPAP
ncbi:hypothetical protein ACGFMM_32485 [Streptomyces sp. NPDC048604]|uniref:hypothetical protein n=1 Tax=Streptomyces sp. NPDC048604 TaxID=3365578 RepID=UPI0037212E53